jgi:aminoglycoside phosphotransferase
MPEEIWDRLFRWVESIMGGKIVWKERQPRWRPAWYFDVEVGGRTVPLYWRGFRGRRDRRPSVYDRYPIEQEAALLQVLEAHGIPVPHVYGFCPDPRGILMARAPGKAEFHHIPDEAEREALAREFMEILARTHRIPPEAFEAIGMERPRTPEEQALNIVSAFEEEYRASIRTPVPLLEFTLRWLRRNIPPRMGPTVLVQGDTGPGQFLFQNGKVTAVIDWEFAHLGHPMCDLAMIRARDLCYPFGDLRDRFRLYSELVGTPLDMPALRYYSVVAMSTTPLGTASVIESPPRSIDYAEYLSWYVLYSRAMVECMAEAASIPLGPVPLPEASPSPRAMAFDVVLKNLREEQLPRITDPYTAYRMNIAVRLVEYARSADALGPATDAADLEDLGALLGRRPENLPKGNAELVALIHAAGPERDADLIRYFHRHLVRWENMLKPAMGEMAVTGTLSPIE